MTRPILGLGPPDDHPITKSDIDKGYAMVPHMKEGVIINDDYVKLTNRQAALICATGKHFGFPGTTDLESVLLTAEKYLEWLTKE